MGKRFILTTYKNRHRLEVFYQILQSAKKPTFKTHIMYKSNLSYTRFKRDLELLVEKGLILRIVKNPHDIYQTTNRGSEFLKAYQTVKSILEE